MLSNVEFCGCVGFSGFVIGFFCGIAFVLFRRSACAWLLWVLAMFGVGILGTMIAGLRVIPSIAYIAPRNLADVVEQGFGFMSTAVPSTIGWYAARAFCRITRRRRVHHQDDANCARCGFLLRGLVEPRCPECGTPFDGANLTANRW